MRTGRGAAGQIVLDTEPRTVSERMGQLGMSPLTGVRGSVSGLRQLGMFIMAEEKTVDSAAAADV